MIDDTPQSAWTDTAEEPTPQTPPLEDTVRTDVVIIGAGFTGLSAALHLAEAGVGVAVLEAATPGFGASGRNGGQVIPGLKHDPRQIEALFGPDKGPKIADFVGRTADVVFALIDHHAIACTPYRAGWVQGVHAKAALPAVEARLADWQARGAPVTLLNRDEMQARTGAQGYVAGLFDQRGGTLNPLAFARGLARAALSAGAQIFGTSPAINLVRQGPAYRISAPKGAVTAERVLLATNGYTDDLWPGLKTAIVPFHSYQIATEPLGNNLGGMLMPDGLGLSDTRRLLTYARQDARGRLIVGGRGRPRESDAVTDYRHVVDALRRVFPDAGDLSIERVWGGKVALTADHLPHIAELAPGLVAALGYNGRGVAMATATGQALARYLSDIIPLEDLPLPSRPIRQIPLHGLRQPVLNALVGVKRLQDWWEARNG
ncbi:MAG: FAD-binding oxidoreductase [Pseudomonadota bacterium]